MAGLVHLYDIKNKKGSEFLDELFNKKLVVSEKPDGCLKNDTIIETMDGFMTIEEICKNKYSGKVKSYCTVTNTIVWDYIIDHLEKEDNKEWYLLETDCGKTLTVTGNHEIYCKNLDIWKRVDELDGTEILVVD